MKIFDILNPYEILQEEMLDEAILSTDFSFGFELEGVCDSEDPDFRNQGFLPGYHSVENPPEGGALNLLNYLNDTLGVENTSGAKIESDSSLRVTADTNKTGHAWTFEYGSPVIPFNPSNINKVYNFLKEIKKKGIKTNDSCGFHTHISFTDITRQDAAWILFCIANDEKLMDEVTELNVAGQDPIQFFSPHYANKSWFIELQNLGSSTKNFVHNTGEKYLVMRIHPQGTIEWRGPRGFMNTDADVSMIKGYITKLYRLILKMADIKTLKEYKGFNREEILSRIILMGSFHSEAETKKTRKMESIWQKMVDEGKGDILIKMSMNLFRAMITDLQKESNTFLRQCFDSIPTFKQTWNKLSLKRKYLLVQPDPSILIERGMEVIPTNGVLSEEDTELYITFINKTIEILEHIIQFQQTKFTFKNSKQVEELVASLIKKIEENRGFNNTDTIKNLIRFMKEYEQYLTVLSYKWLLQLKKYYLFGAFDKLPTKVQNMLVRKNPYNIQYIKSPDASIVNNLVKEYGEDIEEYVIGEI